MLTPQIRISRLRAFNNLSKISQVVSSRAQIQTQISPTFPQPARGPPLAPDSRQLPASALPFPWGPSQAVSAMGPHELNLLLLLLFLRRASFRRLQMPPEVSHPPPPWPHPLSIPVLSKRLWTPEGVTNCVEANLGIVGGASDVPSTPKSRLC